MTNDLDMFCSLLWQNETQFNNMDNITKVYYNYNSGLKL